MPTFEELQAQGAQPVEEHGSGMTYEQLSAMGATPQQSAEESEAGYHVGSGPFTQQPLPEQTLSSPDAMTRAMGNPISETAKVPLSAIEQDFIDGGHTEIAADIATFRQTAAQISDPKALATMVAFEPLLGIKHAGAVLKVGFAAAGGLQAASGAGQAYTGKTPLDTAEGIKNTLLGLSNMLPAAVSVHEGLMKRPGPANVISGAISPGSDLPNRIMDNQVNVALPYIRAAEKDFLAGNTPVSVPDYMDTTGTNQIQLKPGDKIETPDSKTMTDPSQRGQVLTRLQAFANLAKEKIWNQYMGDAPDVNVPQLQSRLIGAAKGALMDDTAMGVGKNVDKAGMRLINRILGASEGYDPNTSILVEPKGPPTYRGLLKTRAELNAEVNAFMSKNTIDKATAINSNPLLKVKTALANEIGIMLQEVGLPKEQMDAYGALKDTEEAAGKAEDLYSTVVRAKQASLPYRQMSGLSLAGAGAMRRARGEGGTSTVEYGLVKTTLEYLSSMASDAARQTNRAMNEYRAAERGQYPLSSPLVRKADLIKRLKAGSAKVAGLSAAQTIQGTSDYMDLVPTHIQATGQGAINVGNRVTDWFSGQ